MITIFQPRGLYIIATVSMSVVSVIFSVQGFFKNRKKYKEDKKERVEALPSLSQGQGQGLGTALSEATRRHVLPFPSDRRPDQDGQNAMTRGSTKKHRFILTFGYRLGLGKVPTSYRAQIWSGRAQWEERCLGRRRLCPVPSPSKDRQSSDCSQR